MFSCEGLGMAFVGLILVSDGLGLLVLSLLGINIDAALQLRILPNIILMIGLLSFSSGLLIGNPIVKNISYDLSIKNKQAKKRVLATGYFLTFIGLFMKLYALFSWGFASLGGYLSGMYMYQATKQGGGFMDSGLNIALFGLSLLVACCNESRYKQLFIIAFMFAISFTLSFSKSGMGVLVLILAITLYFFNRSLFKQFAKPKFIIFVLIIFIIGLGIKTQVKYGQGANISLESSDILATSIGTIGKRYGPFGLYRGYSFMVNRLVENPSLFFGTKVLRHALTGWIPRVIWPDKQGHPFHAIGYLTNEDFSVDIYGNYAPTFAGFAFADNGYLSLVSYCFAGGFLLGLIRKVIASQRKYLFLSVLGYNFLVIVFGQSISESGLTSLLYQLVFSSALVFTVFMFLGLKNLIRISVSRSLYPQQCPQV